DADIGSGGQHVGTRVILHGYLLATGRDYVREIKARFVPLAQSPSGRGFDESRVRFVARADTQTQRGRRFLSRLRQSPHYFVMLWN
ncbi:hypothetical protein WCQ02_41460, partial [Paraburkholderia tropica]|uniref:hypothetical protein n=1 Tax=Paraburkholderia tropica TaxID=92647 RepID=UPI00301A0229